MWVCPTAYIIPEKSPQRVPEWVFMKRRQNPWEPHLNEGHWTVHGPLVTADTQWVYANNCLYFILVFSEKIYQGMKSSVVMFETVVGHSFKCVSEQSIQLSTHLQLKTMNVQYQAFDFEDDHFGNGKSSLHHVANKNFGDPRVVSSCFVCV